MSKYLQYSFLFLCIAVTTSFSAIGAEVVHLICEYHENPIGIDVKIPRLSWQIVSDEQGVMQTAYKIRVAETKDELKRDEGLIWTSGKVSSDQSVNVIYEGPTLQSMQRLYWQVRIWDQDKMRSSWSEAAYWEMGILKQSLWTASYVGMSDITREKKSHPSQFYRSEFNVQKSVKSARVQATSLGVYQLFLNGIKVGNDLFTPGYTSYHHRLQYQTYDVTKMIGQSNAIGAIVGDGWYRGNIGWKGDYAYYGNQLALLIQLHIEYTDGTTETLVTDKDWKASYGPILKSDMYNGEKYDARLEMEGWAEKGFDDTKWSKVEIVDHPKDVLVAPQGPPVRAIEEIIPIKMLTTPKGEIVLDLGQNIVGWARMKVSGQRGDKVTLKFAEVLDKEGNFYTKNLRAAEATDIYILKGGAEEIFEPHFTTHGFRFIQVIDYPGKLELNNIVGIVIHSAMKETGSFNSSDPMVNQLQSNIRWGQKDNFLDIPTDCPQRDERAGWTGDAQVFSMTAAYNFDVAAFYTKWLQDLAADQHESGLVTNVVPDILIGGKDVSARGGATGWADAAVIIPWTVYQSYGDERILKSQYASMKGWVDYMAVQSGEDFLWNDIKHWHWGDWLAYNADKPDYNGSVTEKDLIATAYAYYSTTLLSKIATIIDKQDDASKYKELARNIKNAFVQEYITPNGRLVSHTQTAYALAISFDLIPANLKERSAQYFAQDVEKFGHLTTGFLGTPLLCSALSDIGRDDLAFMLLNRKEYPSWLYPITQGATTIWERWDTQKPDGTIIEGMNSFNHYAYGAIGEWMYNYVGGLQIDPENPGYKNIIFDPHPGGGLTSAHAEILSLYGNTKSAWEIKDNEFIYEIVIPANTTASVTLPEALLDNISLNGKEPDAVIFEALNQGSDGVHVELGSGTYRFSYPVRKMMSLDQSVKAKNDQELIYLCEERLEKVKYLIKQKDTFFTNAYDKLIAIADKELSKEPNPVTNKTQIPPSGDMHDYISIAPYRWPNPDTPDGSPWIVKDGQINPMTRGNNTDKVRLSEMFYALDHLSMSYYFSNDVKYANKAKSIIETWFIDEETKVNPNINYGQGIPGEVEGRRAGMIEWRSISTVINTIQMLASDYILNDEEMGILNTWILEYYTWVKTNKMGIENDNGLQNHSTCYDYQLVGLARYLGLDEEAKSRLEAAKLKRIATQISPDGKQAKEIGRTKSVHYCSMNLRIMTFLAEMGEPLGVDLWNYSTADGRSMKKAYDFLRPYAEGKEEWAYKQITLGGATEAIDTEMKPLFSIASTIFNEELIDENVQAYQYLNYMEKLIYPPLFKINK